ncbi:MAG: glycosyltransferase family 9 protein, partial [Candidatus Omnitrophota bacterium]
MKLSNVNKILFITLSNIGDVILTLPVLAALRDNFKDAKIDVIVGPRPKQIFEKDPRVNRVFVYDKHAKLKDKIKFIKRLRKEKYSLAIDMKASLLPLLIGAKNTALLPIQLRRLETSSRRSWIGPKHKRLVHLEKLRPFGITYTEQKNIYIDDEARKKIEKVLKDNGVGDKDILIGVSPSSRSHLKQWKKEGFIQVIKKLLENPGYKIILIGDMNEAKLSKEIEKEVTSHGLIDLTGRTNLNELFALIEKFSLLLT